MLVSRPNSEANHLAHYQLITLASLGDIYEAAISSSNNQSIGITLNGC